MVVLHDRGDLVILVSESRRLQFALSGRAGVHYTELLFQHLDPTKRRLPLFRLVQQLGLAIVLKCLNRLANAIFSRMCSPLADRIL
jgi:hypothetical protein